MSAKSVLCRADDFGSFRAANRGIAAGLAAGVLRNVSVMVATPYWREAAELARRFPRACFGLHGTLTSEWRSPRWSPVLGAARVPNLVREDGSFLEAPLALHERGPDLDQMREELLAQVRLAREAGIPIAYFDEHMAFAWVHAPGRPDRRAIHMLRDLCREQGLLFQHDHQAACLPGSLSGLARTQEALLAADGGTLLVVNHPAFADEELLGLSHVRTEDPPGSLAAARFDDLRLWLDPGFAAWLAEHGIASTTYAEAPAAYADRELYPSQHPGPHP